MSANPGDSGADRRPFPPFGPALSRPSQGASDSGAAAPLPPFAPFARPQASAHTGTAAPSPSGVEEREAIAEDAAPFTPAAIETDEDVWMPWEEPDATLQAGAEPAVTGSEVADDLPWLDVEPVEPAPPAGEAADAEELPAWLSWDDAVEEVPTLTAAVDSGEGLQGADAPFSFGAEPEPVAGEAGPYGDGAVEVAEVASDDGAGEAGAEMEDFYAVEENAAAEAALYAPAPEVEHPEAVVGPAVEALAEVADRLERIARSLRERPADVLAGGDGAADPLELLITGFALGYAQGRGRGDRPSGG